VVGIKFRALHVLKKLFYHWAISPAPNFYHLYISVDLDSSMSNILFTGCLGGFLLVGIFHLLIVLTVVGLYHLSHTPSSLCFSYFQIGSHFLPKLASDCDSPTYSLSCSWDYTCELPHLAYLSC
jgi:hypothetical protein